MQTSRAAAQGMRPLADIENVWSRAELLWTPAEAAGGRYSGHIHPTDHRGPAGRDHLPSEENFLLA